MSHKSIDEGAQRLITRRLEAIVLLGGYGLAVLFVPTGMVLTLARDRQRLAYSILVAGIVLGAGSLFLLAQYLAVSKRQGSLTSFLSNPFDKRRISVMDHVMGAGGWYEACSVLGLDFRRWNRVRIVSGITAIIAVAIWAALEAIGTAT